MGQVLNYHQRRRIQKQRKKLGATIILTLLIASLTLILSGCNSHEDSPGQVLKPTPTSTPTPAPRTAPERSYYQEQLAWEREGKGHSTWTTHLRKIVGASTLAGYPAVNMEKVCPNYHNLPVKHKPEVWAQLISIMAKYESGFKPETTFTEPDIHDAKGIKVVSTGLLQISVESANSYGCGITFEGLKNWEKNLTCAVLIMEKNVARNGQAFDKKKVMFKGKPQSRWQGASAYWSVAREGVSNSFPKVQKYMMNLNHCKFVVP